MTAGSLAPAGLIGRQAAPDVLFDLVDGVREGDRARTLIMRGEPGVGKTSLLAAARHRASDGGFQVLSTAGAQAEADLPYSGLHQLLLPLLAGTVSDCLDQLPGRQRDALACAFGLGSDAAPDRFLVGLGVLTLLSQEAEERPLLCAVDDAQ